MQNTPETPPGYPDDTDLYNEDFGDSPEFDLYAESLTKTAANIMRFLEIEEEKKAIDNVVFSLEQTILDNQAKNPIDFSDILTTNARILNAGFEFYLNKAHTCAEGDAKILMAMKMQGQLARTIDTWRRLAHFQKGGTK